MRGGIPAAAILLLLLSPAASAEPAPPADRPSVLLVTIDTWRADYLGASGAGRVKTPFLDRLAREGSYLPRVQAPCPLTTPSHATIFTGRTPARHGIRDNVHFRLRPDVPTLAEAFRSAGYATVGVVSASPLRRKTGLDRGFDSWDDGGFGDDGARLVPKSRPGDETTERAVEQARKASAGGRPAFVFVHFYDPHSPYDPPEPFRSQYPKDPYAGEVAFADRNVERLVSSLGRIDGRRWIVVVTADHGESLGEHGEDTHGLLLHQSTLAVPLIFHPRIEVAPSPGEPVGLVDVAPTLCALASLDCARSDGTSLLAPRRNRTLAAETAFPALGFGVNPALALRRGDRIWIHHGAEEVYDLRKDPSESVNLAERSSGKALRKELAGAMQTEFGSDPFGSMVAGGASPTEEERKKLAALGYAGGSRTAPDRIEKADLRVFAADFRKLSKSRELVARGRDAEAVAGYEAFLTRHPKASLAWQELGSVYGTLGRHDDSRRAFAKALALDPEDVVAALNLGHLGLRREDATEAERFYRRVLELDDAQPKAHLHLGLIEADIRRRPGRALAHLRRFLELAPEDPRGVDVRALVSKLEGAAREE